MPFANKAFILFISVFLMLFMPADMAGGESGKGYYNVYFKLDESSISTQRYKNIDKAVFEIFKTSLLKLPYFQSVMDEDFDINITISLAESDGEFTAYIEIIHGNLRSKASLEKKSNVFYEVQKDFLQIVIEALKLKPTREQYSNHIKVSTESLNALIYYGDALEMMKSVENLQLFDTLAKGVLADGSFSLLMSLYRNVFRNLERFYTDSIKFSRLNKDNYMKLIDLYMIHGDFTKALQVIQDGKSVFGDVKEFNLKEGDLYFEADNYESAINIYKSILEDNDRNVDILLRLGKSYLKLNETSTSIQVLDRILSIQPENNEALSCISDAYTKQGDYDNALSKLRALLSLSGDNAEIQNRIAFIYYLKKDYDKAINILSGIISKEKNSITSLELLGDIYVCKKDYSNAAYFYNTIVKYDPENVNVYGKLAEVYSDAGDERLNNIYITLGNLYKRRNEFEKAKEYYRKVHEINKDDPLYYYEMGNLYYSLADYDQAIDHYQKAEEMEFYEPDMLINMVSIYLLQNRLKSAMGAVRKGLEIEPENPEFIFSEAKIFYYQKDYEKAIKILKSIEDKMNDNYEYFYIRGIMAFDRCQYESGIKYLKKAFMLNRNIKIDNPGVKTYLAISGLFDDLQLQHGDEYSLVIAMPEKGALNTAVLDLRGKKYDKKSLQSFLIEIISARLRIKSIENTVKYINNSNVDIYSASFVSYNSLNKFISHLKSDGIIFIDLTNTPQDDSEAYKQGNILSNIHFYRRGMQSPEKFAVPIAVAYQKSVILLYAGIIFAVAAFFSGGVYGYLKYKAIKRGYGALRIKIIFPANRRIPMNVTLSPTKRIATLDMGEVLFTRLVVGDYQALFRGMLTRYDEVMDEEREIGDFRMKEPVNIKKNEISEILLDFSKELYVEVYVTRKNQYLEGAEVMVRELNITKFTNYNGYASFILPKMAFSFIVSYDDINLERKFKIDDDNTTIFIEIDPLLKPISYQKKPVEKIDFEYLD